MAQNPTILPLKFTLADSGAAIIFAALNQIYQPMADKFSTAQVAKLVDALCSGRSAFTGVLVRIQSWALFLA